MNMTPEDIIEAIDALPEVDQAKLLDAIVPGADGTFDHYGEGARLARLHRMVDTFSQLRSDIADEAISDVFTSPERLRDEFDGYVSGDDRVDFAVRVILDLEHGAKVSRGTIAQAAKNLLDECVTRDPVRASSSRLDAEFVPEELFSRAFLAVEAVEEHLHASFEWDGDYKNLEQVRPFMPAFLRVFDEVKVRDTLAYNDDFIGKVPGIAGSPHESTGIYLLQGLKRRDEYHAKVAALRADGFVEFRSYVPGQCDDLEPGFVFGRFPEVVVCHDGGSTGGGDTVARYEDARIVFVRATRSDVQLAIMKPRQRVNGVAVPHGATILFKES